MLERFMKSFRMELELEGHVAAGEQEDARARRTENKEINGDGFWVLGFD